MGPLLSSLEDTSGIDAVKGEPSQYNPFEAYR